MDSLIWFFAVPFIYMVLLSVALYFFIYYKFFDLKKFKETFSLHGKQLSLVFFSAFASYCLASFVKIIVHTHRPFILWSRVRPLFMENGYAFPSGHSATIAAFAFAVFFKHKKIGYLKN
jgi:membrane-associated phospholipid phosphatase